MPHHLVFSCCACCRTTGHAEGVVHHWPCPQHQNWTQGTPTDPEPQPESETA